VKLLGSSPLGRNLNSPIRTSKLEDKRGQKLVLKAIEEFNVH